ncbi:MAG: VCBS repeat-containing protein [Gammaproteobacteria bacterium]|nr:VCBS repeat-containing protein [Gammaproteobacteria bacterium]
MRILGSSVQLTSVSERELKASQSTLQTRTAARSSQNSNQEGNTQLVSLSSAADYRYSSARHSESQRSSTIVSEEYVQSLNSYEQLESLTQLALRGEAALRVTSVLPQDSPANPVTVNGPIGATFSRYQHIQLEQSQLFAASGSVTLTDGRQIDFSLYLKSSEQHDYRLQETLSLQVMPRQDPLVLNFGRERAALQDGVFAFDLNADGQQEWLARLGSGSGYLVFDRNGNGAVDDGNELFGTRTGSGFAELAEFDADGNGWLDAGDPAFEQLQLWVEEGDQRQLRSLREMGVGAIYLGSTSSDFDLTASDGRVLGNVKASGLFLTLDGEVRSVEELDLVMQRDPNAPLPEAPAAAAVTAQSTTAQPSRLDALTAARDETIRLALSKLSELRAQQKAAAQGDNGLERKPSPLERLLTKMRELEMQMQARRSRQREAVQAYTQPFAASVGPQRPRA